jgi:hypothetical protein
MRGEGGSCGVSANEHGCTGAQINFGDRTPYLSLLQYFRVVRRKKNINICIFSMLGVNICTVLYMVHSRGIAAKAVRQEEIHCPRILIYFSYK